MHCAIYQNSWERHWNRCGRTELTTHSINLLQSRPLQIECSGLDCNIPQKSVEVQVNHRICIERPYLIWTDCCQSSDWVGSFFACNPCVSRGTGFFNSGCHVSLDNSKQFKIRVKNVWFGGFEPCWHPPVPFIGCRSWTTLLPDMAFDFSVYNWAAACYKIRCRRQGHAGRPLPMCNPFDIDLPF